MSEIAGTSKRLDDASEAGGSDQPSEDYIKSFREMIESGDKDPVRVAAIYCFRAQKNANMWEHWYEKAEEARRVLSEKALLARIGAAVLERVDEEGFSEENFAACPTCGRAREFALAHEDDCPITEALEHE